VITLVGLYCRDDFSQGVGVFHTGAVKGNPGKQYGNLAVNRRRFVGPMH
jgi:hypothetical protein